MLSSAATPLEYLEACPEHHKQGLTSLRNVIVSNLPPGFTEGIANGMIGYAVPHDLYPPGYHVNPKLPLPFLAIASQKNFIALYHMGLYANEKLLDWFVTNYPAHSTTKLDMGKSCIRFKRPETIPLKLIGELVSKMSVNEWVSLYERTLDKKG
ncbi:DUF1801 domain-containing protein [Flavitalea antarctica]